MAKGQKIQPLRKIRFEGNHQHNAILIGNHSDSRITIKGTFHLSGIVYAKAHTVEFIVLGSGTLRFHGYCKRLVIRIADGECLLDFENLTSKSICCQELKGGAQIVVGKTAKIEEAHLSDNASLRYYGKPLVLNYTIADKAVFEPLRQSANPNTADALG